MYHCIDKISCGWICIAVKILYGTGMRQATWKPDLWPDKEVLENDRNRFADQLFCCNF